MRPWLIALRAIVWREALRFVQQRGRFFAALVRPLVWLLVFAAGFRAALPKAEVHAYEDAGHYVLEDKHEILVPLIRDFLDRHPLT